MAELKEEVKGTLTTTLVQQIEKVLEKIDVKKHFPKVTNEKFKLFMQGLGKNVMKDPDVDEMMNKLLIFSGSFMEGAPFARLVNPTLKKNYIEFEFDMMFPMGHIIDNKCNEIINDLEHAKGFAWLKYDKEAIEIELKNGKTISDYVTKHNNGIDYLNSNAFKEEFSKDPFTKPDMSYFTKFTEEIQGPSNNVDMVMMFKKIGEELKNSKQEDFIEGVKCIDKILGFIQQLYPYLVKAHQNILKIFSTFRRKKEKDEIIISQLDINEFKGKTVPTTLRHGNVNGKNELLFLHWSLIAFINEMILIILTIETNIIQTDLLKLLGVFRHSFMPLFGYPMKLKQSLIDYIMHLGILPKKMNQGDDDGTVDDIVEIFLCETIGKMPTEVELVLKTFQRCLKILPTRMLIVKGIACHFKDREELNIPEQDECCLNIDRVPAIFVQQLPTIALEFKTRQREWPSLDVMKHIFDAGFHLVPKPSIGERKNEMFDWRWSFSKAEMILANNRTDAMDTAYLILKSIIYKYYKCHDVDDKTIPSYFAKTVMMLACESHPEHWWTERSICECVTMLLENLKMFFEQGFLPHYFIHDLNLLDGVPGELVEFGIAVSQSVCQDPLPCILEVLSSIADVQKEKNEKNDRNVLNESGGAKKKVPLSKKKQVNPAQQMFGREGSKSAIEEETLKLPLLLAEFRVTLEHKELEFKERPDMQGINELSRKIYEVTLRAIPEEFEKSKFIHPVYDPEWKLSFSLKMQDIKDELENTEVYGFSFRGSTTMEWKYSERG